MNCKRTLQPIQEILILCKGKHFVFSLDGAFQSGQRHFPQRPLASASERGHTGETRVYDEAVVAVKIFSQNSVHMQKGVCIKGARRHVPSDGVSLLLSMFKCMAPLKHSGFRCGNAMAHCVSAVNCGESNWSFKASQSERPFGTRLLFVDNISLCWHRIISSKKPHVPWSSKMVHNYIKHWKTFLIELLYNIN